ncbi:MAG: TrkA family potassium uptake protein [Ferrimicrobium sp.]|nr:TrkA family potassium uptake protein [Ferrimicrobium sp.]
MTSDRILVVGCGRVGAELATRLATQGLQVTILDRNARAFRRLAEHPNITRLEGMGFDPEILKEAKIEGAYGLAAVTSGDNTNILSARIAREVFNVPNVVARIYDPRRAVVYQRLGIATVATVTWTTEQAIRRLFPEKTPTDWTDASGTVSVMEVSLPSSLAGVQLASLNVDNAVKFAAILRGTSARLIERELIAQEGDRAIVLVTTAGTQRLQEILKGS